MASKKNLLKELGWSDELISHFMIDDSEYTDTDKPELVATVYDMSSFIVNSNQKISGNAVIVGLDSEREPQE